MTTVSACMIGKNEEELLPQCLESIHRWVDEIIFVDTGSTDRTVEIAESYGAKIYHHPWENNFSLHRNQSIGYATGDWVFIIDCDETVPVDMTRFKERLDKIHACVAALVVRVFEVAKGETNTSWLGVRFFRKDSGVHYKGSVHNKAVYDGACAATDVVMHHYGYSLPPEKMKAKRRRTEGLLQDRLDKDPEDHAALYYMCQMRIGERRYAEAEEFGDRFFRCVPVGPDRFQFYSVMYFYMAWACLNQNDGNRAVDWALKGLEFYPDDVDLNYIMARIGYQAERDDWLKEYGERYTDLVENPVVQPESGQFAEAIDPKYWVNRTIYSNIEAVAKEIKRIMAEAA